MKKVFPECIGFTILATALYFGAYSAYWTLYKNKTDCYFSKGIKHGASLLFHQAVSEIPFINVVLLEPNMSANYYLRILIADSKGEQIPSFECRWIETVDEAKSRYPNASAMISRINKA